MGVTAGSLVKPAASAVDAIGGRLARVNNESRKARIAELAAQIEKQNFYRDGWTPDVASPQTLANLYKRSAEASTNNPSSSEVVLGKYINNSDSSYDAVARKRGATYFSMGDWDEVKSVIGSERMWEINRTFLDQQIAQNKNFIFTSDPSKSSGYFTKLEYRHLRDSGYRVIREGDFYRAFKP